MCVRNSSHKLQWEVLGQKSELIYLNITLRKKSLSLEIYCKVLLSILAMWQSSLFSLPQISVATFQHTCDVSSWHMFPMQTLLLHFLPTQSFPCHLSQSHLRYHR